MNNKSKKKKENMMRMEIEKKTEVLMMVFKELFQV